MLVYQRVFPHDFPFFFNAGRLSLRQTRIPAMHSEDPAHRNARPHFEVGAVGGLVTREHHGLSVWQLLSWIRLWNIIIIIITITSHVLYSWKMRVTPKIGPSSAVGATLLSCDCCRVRRRHWSFGNLFRLDWACQWGIDQVHLDS